MNHRSFPVRGNVQRGALAVVGLAACSIPLGCASTTHSARASSSVHRPASTNKWSPPKIITATRLAGPRARHSPRRGTLINSANLRVRVFVSDKRGFALAGVPSGTYPAATRDGGRHWVIDGPVLWIPAADAPLNVTLVGAAPPRTYFAYGNGSVVDFTNDAGRHWWSAALGDDVLSVVPGTKDHHLIAVVQDSATSSSRTAIPLVYLSTDDGHHWQLTKQFAY